MLRWPNGNPTVRSGSRGIEKMQLSSLEIVALIAVLLLLYFGLILDVIKPAIISNPVAFGLSFMLLFAVLSSVIVYGNDLMSVAGIKKMLALFFVLMAFDIVVFPLQITKDATARSTLSPEMKVSADWIVFSIFPAELPHELRYYLTYVFVPILLFALAAMLLDRMDFARMLKLGVS